MVRPWLRTIQPMPPPVVSPPTPTDLVSPEVSDSPCAPSVLATSPHRAPAPTRTRSPSSTSTPANADMSMTRPPSLVPQAWTLCPPLRIDSGSPAATACWIAAATCSTVRGLRTSAGEPVRTYTVAAAAYASSPGR